LILSLSIGKTGFLHRVVSSLVPNEVTGGRIVRATHGFILLPD
jgi:hypothetical protein